MVKYTCSTCEKVFNQKSHLDNHLNRKYPCEQVKNKVVINEDNKYDLLVKKILELEGTVNKVQQENKEIKQYGKKLEKEIKTLKKSKSINQVNSNNNTINIIVVPNAYGKEDLSFIDSVISKKILDKGYQSIPEFVRQVHFNKDKPENHNIYMPNWRDKGNCSAFDGNLWNIIDGDEILTDLKDKALEFIQTKFEELDKNDKNDKLIIKKIERFIESFTNGEKTDVLDKDLQLVLYNNRKLVETTKKVSTKK